MAKADQADKASWKMWPIEKILPYPLNAKDHDAKQIAKIAASIKKFDWIYPILVDKDGTIIAGHGRRLAALSLGMTEAPVLQRSDLSPEEVRALRLADNRVAISNIDSDILQKELATLDFDMDGIFDKKELSFLDADMGELNPGAFIDDIDAAVEQQAAETVLAIAAADEKKFPSRRRWASRRSRARMSARLRRSWP
ncbi:ParB/Srx family N-terminal domain-containing protein [Polaromonas sp. P1(28)-13]|nr:ParB/Srx family N-terminal domain-containing protein [Polaromonas sp. P1(28)-13]